MKKITIVLLTSACALTISNNSLGMIKDPQDPSVSFDTVALLTENNKLLREIKAQNHDIKRQNRSIIKQNNLIYQYQAAHTEICASRDKSLTNERTKIEEKYKLHAKIKEIYLNERLTDKSWSSSD